MKKTTVIVTAALFVITAAILIDQFAKGSRTRNNPQTIAPVPELVSSPEFATSKLVATAEPTIGTPKAFLPPTNSVVITNDAQFQLIREQHRSMQNKSSVSQ